MCANEHCHLNLSFCVARSNRGFFKTFPTFTSIKRFRYLIDIDRMLEVKGCVGGQGGTGVDFGGRLAPPVHFCDFSMRACFYELRDGSA